MPIYPMAAEFSPIRSGSRRPRPVPVNPRGGAVAPILIADDDSQMCLLIEEALRRVGHPVASTHTGRDALDWLQRAPARLLLLDVQLPDMSGIEILDAIERGDSPVPFIVISGLADTKLAVDYMRRGARDYILKEQGFVEMVPEVVQRALQDLERDQQLERLQREILEISEREQRRIGQDLHDDLCQRLAAIKMQMQQLAEELTSMPSAQSHRVQRIARHLGDATRAARALARGLSPVDIGHEGLPAALDGLVRNAEEIFQIRCAFKAHGTCPPLDHRSATQLYRIAQEAITNAVKHGKASEVTVSLEKTARALVLSIINNGEPFERSSQSTGLGLCLMQLRADTIGATLHFLHHPPEGGTLAVRVILPLR